MEPSTPVAAMTPPGSAQVRPAGRAHRAGLDAAPALVRKLDGLLTLDEADRFALAGLGRYVRTVERNVVVGEQGAIADHAPIVLSGFAGRSKRRASGRRQILAYLVPGDHCDRGALHGLPLGHSIETLTTCRIARVPRAVYLDMIARHPRVAFAMQRAKLVEEATAREWLAGIGMRTATERLAHLLCELLERLAAVGGVAGGQFDLPLTQVDLADTLGLSSVHVNRVMQALRREGLITLRCRRLQVQQPVRLRELAEFEASYLKASAVEGRRLGVALAGGGPMSVAARVPV